MNIQEYDWLMNISRNKIGWCIFMVDEYIGIWLVDEYIGIRLVDEFIQGYMIGWWIYLGIHWLMNWYLGILWVDEYIRIWLVNEYI